jgi:hypothetical protein
MMAKFAIQAERPEMPEWVHAWIEADDKRIWPPEEGAILENT